MQLRRQFAKGVDAGRGDTALKRAETRRSRGRSFVTRGLTAVLLAVFAALLVLPLQALPVQAQTPASVWSGTLTVRNMSGVLGCSNGVENNNCSVHLSDDDFTHDSTDYAFTHIFLRTNGRLEITFDTDLTTATQGLTLNVGSTAFTFDSADIKGTNTRSWNGSGLSWTAGNSVSLTLTEPATAPDAPTGLTGTANGETEIKLSWTAPAADGGETITGYKVEVSANGTSGWSNVVADTASTDTTYSHTGLSAVNTRFYRVSAINSAGTGVASNVGGATTAAANVLVSNTGQNVDPTVFVSIGNQDKTHSQGFDTGQNPGGYNLTSVGVYVDDEVLNSGETFTVHIYTDDGSGGMDTLAYTLTSPASYTDRAVNTFTAPAGATLDADTDYLVVFEGTGNSTTDFRVGATPSNGQDRGTRGGWGIENAYRLNGTSTSTGNSYQVSVNGSAIPTEVPATWALIPTGLNAGDTFRLLFLSSTGRAAEALGIGTYNNFIKNRAAAGHTDIQTYSDDFKVVGCTEDDDATDNTRTIYTNSDKGVPIYWLGGAKAADDYEDFYDGSWDEEANDKNESGTDGPDTSLSANRPWTGCDHDGTSEDDYLGDDATTVGWPNDSGSANGPLSSASRFISFESRPLYGLSELFQVVGNRTATGKPTLSGAAQVGMTLTAGTADIMDADGLTSPGYTYQWLRAGSDISGATSSTYTLTSSDYGETIQVKVEFTDDASNTESLTSDETVPVAPVAATCPTDTGTVWCATLTVGHSLDSDGDPSGSGFEARSGRTAFGSVSGATFTHLGVNYTVTTVWGGAQHDLVLATTPNLPLDGAGLTLHVQTYGGELDAPLADASFDNSDHWFFGNALYVGSSGQLSDVPLIRTQKTREARVQDPPDIGTEVMVRLSANSAPTFPTTSADRVVAENTAAGQNVGSTFTATDSDGDTITYTLEGTDAASFDLATVSSSAQIRTKTGVTYNFEVQNSYTVVVKADDGNGGTDTIAVTITVTDVNEPPDQPAAPSVSGTAGSTTSLTVNWSAPTNTGPDINSYDLQYRQGNSGNFTNGPQNVNGTTTTIPNLSANTSYQVQVRATNNEGDSPWSPPGTGSTSSPPVTPPGKVFGVNITPGDRILQVNWTRVTGATGYKVQWKSGGQSYGSSRQATISSGSTTSRTISSLNNGTEYTVRVIATKTGASDGTPSADVNGTPTSAITSPTAPRDLNATAVGNNRINLSWNAPASDGGSPITGYKIEVSSNGNSWTTRVANTGSSSRTYSHTGLSTGDTRHYRVSAINSSGTGPHSNFARATTGLPVVSIASASTTEGQDIVFTVTISPPISGFRRLSYGTGSDSIPSGSKAATAGTDYVTPHTASKVIQIGYGLTSVEIRFRTIDDDLVEGTEVFGIGLHGSGDEGRDYSVGTRTVIGTIRDNDNNGQRYVDTVRGNSSTGASISVGGSVTGRIEEVSDADWYRTGLTKDHCYRIGVAGSSDSDSLTLPYPALFGVYRTDSTRISGTSASTDYAGNKAISYVKLDTSGTYYISVGVHRFLGEGTYRLSLRDLGTSDTSCGAAKLAGPVQISVADVSREESESTRTYLIFEVTLNRYADKEVRVSYATVDGTARAGRDYESQSGTLVFERRDRTKQIWVPIEFDDEDEETETLTLRLSNAVGGQIRRVEATGSIYDYSTSR